MKQELISVIVPIYNVEKYLHQCVESIRAQTYTAIEIILVDDGSPDNCGQICDEYAEKDNRVKVIHKQNGGLSSARNAGMDIATGAYLTFVDSDDYIAPNMLEELYKELIKSGADLCISPFQRVDENGSFLSKMDIDFIGSITRKEALYKLAYGWSGCPVVSCGKLGKMEIYKTLRFREGKVHEDEFMFHELLNNCNSITHVETIYYFYVQRQGSIVNSSFSIKRFDGVEAIIERAKFYLNIGWDDAATAILHAAARMYCIYYERIEEFNEATMHRLDELKAAIKTTFKKLKPSIKEFKRKTLIRIFLCNFRFYRWLHNRVKK